MLNGSKRKFKRFSFTVWDKGFAKRRGIEQCKRVRAFFHSLLFFRVYVKKRGIRKQSNMVATKNW